MHMIMIIINAFTERLFIHNIHLVLLLSLFKTFECSIANKTLIHFVVVNVQDGKHCEEQVRKK